MTHTSKLLAHASCGRIRFSRLLNLLTLLAVVESMCAAPDLNSGPGIIHFYEPKADTRTPSDLEDPLVKRAEGIFWWSDIEPEEGKFNWSMVERELKRWNVKGKRLDIRLGTAHIGPNYTPAWLFEKYHVRRIGRGHWCDAEKDFGPFVRGPAAIHTTNAALTISGSASVASVGEVEKEVVLLQMPQAGVLNPGRRYSLQLDYLANGLAKGWVALASSSGALAEKCMFGAESGKRGSFTYVFTAQDDTNGRLLIGSSGGGTFSVDNLHLMPIVEVPTVFFEGMESALRYWQLTPRAFVTSDPALVLSGRASLVLSNSAQGFQPGILNEPVEFPILRGQGYSASFDFKALTPATLRLKLVSRVAPFHVLDEKTLHLNAEDKGTFRWHYPAFVWQDETRLEIGLEGPGRVIADDLRWSQWSDRVTVFPDYFDPVFRSKWERFVTQFSGRYADHPGVGTISVGGFGRWEEVILDDDVPGLLDQQWLARGFSQDRYLKHVEWCMDLYKRLFPKKRLRVCLAYGLKNQNDEDYMYRAVARAAVARGIGLKQNGMSEKYGAWDASTSAPYIFNRYRYRGDINLTYETGGQISRVSPHYSQGHPLSVINRVIIDGADNLFLYGSDIGTRHVHKYFNYADSVMGSPLFTTFYSRLGDYSLIMEHSPSPQEYRNQWLGLREFPSDQAKPLLTNYLGQPCAMTRPGYPCIGFDVDDRQQYQGMHSPVFSVEYLDDGNDSFDVNCFNQFTGSWEKMGSVQKQGNGRWRTASFQKPDWCRSDRGDGEDVHTDVVIDDLGDGIECIAGVELSFVPAREWKRQLVCSEEPGPGIAPLVTNLVRFINAGDPLDWVSIPVSARWAARSGLTGRVVAITASGEVLVSEKNYPMPADGDWLDLPLTPVPGCQRFRVELNGPVGDVGWYMAANGELAYRAWRYLVKPGTQSSASEFVATRPFAGIEVEAQSTIQWEIEILRRADGERWLPVARGSPTGNGKSQRIFFEPQTAGRFQIRTSNSGRALVRPLYLEALFGQTSRLPSAGRAGDQTKKFQVREISLKNLKQVKRGGEYEITGPSPAMEFEIKKIEAGKSDLLQFRMVNRSGAPLVRLSWAGAGQDFAADRSCLIPLIQNDFVLREYEFPVGLEPGWSGPLQKLRFEIFAIGESAGTVRIGEWSFGGNTK